MEKVPFLVVLTYLRQMLISFLIQVRPSSLTDYSDVLNNITYSLRSGDAETAGQVTYCVLSDISHNKNMTGNKKSKVGESLLFCLEDQRLLFKGKFSNHSPPPPHTHIHTYTCTYTYTCTHSPYEDLVSLLFLVIFSSPLARLVSCSVLLSQF